MKRLAVGLILPVLLILLVIGGYWYFVGPGKRGPVGPGEPTLAVQTITPERQRGYRVAREFVGQLEAAHHSQVGFERSGQIEYFLAEEGDSVGAGEILAGLDRDRLTARESVLQASLEVSRARLRQVRLRKEKVKQAFEANAVSEQKWDQVRTEYVARRAAYERARAQLKQVRVDLRKSLLRSPYDAEVVRRVADRGEVVQTGDPVFRLVSRNQFEARVGVSSQAVDRFTVGGTVPLRVGTRRYTATVKSINPAQSVATRTVDVVFRLRSSGSRLRPGRTVTLVASERVRESGFWLPLTALVEAERGLWACYVVESLEDSDRYYRVQKRRLQLLHETTNRAYVTGTLSAGDTVVTTGVNRLVAGQTVTLAESSP